MWACVDLLKKKYGDGVLTLTLKDQYFNMRKMVEPHPQVIDKALRAMEMAGVNPIVRPIRGGTDGARLSFMGLPCPTSSRGHELPRQIRILLAHHYAQGSAGDPEPGAVVGGIT